MKVIAFPGVEVYDNSEEEQLLRRVAAFIEKEGFLNSEAMTRAVVDTIQFMDANFTCNQISAIVKIMSKMYQVHHVGGTDDKARSNKNS